MLRAEIVARHEVQRSRERPEPRFELASLSAGKTLVPLAGVSLEQQRDVRPVTSVALRHGAERDVERAVGALEISRGMEPESGERGAPARVSAAFAGRAHRVRGATIFHEIADSLAGDPGVARYARRSVREPFEQCGTSRLRLGRLRRRRELTVIPPITEAADSNIAASRAPGVFYREIRPARALEVGLRRACVADHALRISWGGYARRLKLGRPQRRSGLKRQC